jgi:nucleotide-binding universal stress UspA family protein
MKTILIPTDFSAVATNSTIYALDFSRQMGANVILFHAYHHPFLLSSLPLVVFGEVLEKVDLETFNNDLHHLIQERYAEIFIECYHFNGSVVDGIKNMIEKHDLDCIIMGITGVNKIKEVLMGSNVIAVIQAIHKPVFVIPQQATFKKIEKCVLAYHFIEETPFGVMDELKSFFEVFKPALMIYGKSSVGLDEFNQIKSSMDRVFCEAGMCEIEHVLTFSEEDDLIEEINTFVAFVRADCLVMTSKPADSFVTVFQRDNTTIMPFHTHLPLLILHEA